MMAYVVALVSAWLALVALTALRPRRRGVLAAISYPVGWVAGELPTQAIMVELALLGLLAWWGWPVGWIDPVVAALAAIVIAGNLALFVASWRARRVVAAAMRNAPDRPLIVASPPEDVYGRWWRTAVKLPVHPRGLIVTTNVPYGPEPRHRLDVWRTSEDLRGAPVIFYVHGGAWTFGDKREQGRPMLHEFAARGWIVVAANYRLAPRDPWPAQIEDVTRTLAWVKRGIGAYGGDPDRVVIAGGSAGGHLAALAALAGDDPAWRSRGDESLDLSVRGCLSYYGVLEMTGDEGHWRGLGWGLRRLLENRVIQVPYDGHEDLYRSLSPLHRLHTGAPPFYVVQGVTDTLVDVQVARNFVEAFRATCVAPIYYVELPLTQHAFDVTASPRTSATTRAAIAFAEAVAAPRAHLDEATLAAYQIPPTELEIEVEGTVLLARDYAARVGRFYVVSSDNPGSVVRDEARNAADRADLATRLAERGVVATATRARDSLGVHPIEVGVAVTDQELAAAVARRYDQLAFYEVTPERVAVIDAWTGLVY